jgi:hypothetical protein
MIRTVDLGGEPVILHEAMKVRARNVFSRAVVVDFAAYTAQDFFTRRSQRSQVVSWIDGADFGQRVRSAAASGRYALEQLPGRISSIVESVAYSNQALSVLATHWVSGLIVHGGWCRGQQMG